MLTTGDYGRRAGRTGRRRRSRRWFNILIVIALLVSIVLLALALLRWGTEALEPSRVVQSDETATFAVLDLGQALSAAVVTDDGHSLVYDFGLTRAGAEDVIAPFFTDYGNGRIDYAILSHPHQDHIGGFPALSESLAIAQYLDPVIETTNQTYLQSLEIIEAEGIPAGMARQGESYTLGADVEFEILWPPDDLLIDSDAEPLINDNSTVVLVTAGDVSLMLTGDIEEAAEQRLVETYGSDLDVDILQIAHHGSSTSSHESFLQAADPEVAVIPVGADNPYGHPHSETIQRLRAYDIEFYRTDVDGTVTIQTDGERYEVNTTGSGLSWNRLP